MKEKNRHILKKAVIDLPEYKADEAIWSGLKSELDKKDCGNYRKAIEELPAFRAPEGIWDRIQIVLDQHQSRYILHGWWLRTAAAAVIFLGIAATLIILRNRQPKEQQMNSINQSGLENPMIYNPLLCQGNPAVCSSPVFIELDNQLNDVKNELDIMLPLVRDKDPQLLKYYYRLENLRMQIEKKMVKMILES